jgi:hypothetical protein
VMDWQTLLVPLVPALVVLALWVIWRKTRR